MINFTVHTIRFVINAPENYTTSLHQLSNRVRFIGEIAFGCLKGDKKKNQATLKTSILACSIVQPAWITLLYTFWNTILEEIRTWGRTMDLRHPAHLNLDMNHFFYHAHQPNKRGFQSYNKAVLFHLKEAICLKGDPD